MVTSTPAKENTGVGSCHDAPMRWIVGYVSSLLCVTVVPAEQQFASFMGIGVTCQRSTYRSYVSTVVVASVTQSIDPRSAFGDSRHVSERIVQDKTRWRDECVDGKRESSAGDRESASERSRKLRAPFAYRCQRNRVTTGDIERIVSRDIVMTYKKLYVQTWTEEKRARFEEGSRRKQTAATSKTCANMLGTDTVRHAVRLRY